MKIKLSYLLIIGLLLLGTSFFVGTLFTKSSETLQLNDVSCSFISTNLQPSTYFGGELKTRRESESQNILIRKDSNFNREILTIYSKQGDVFELWEEDSSRSMNPTISDDSITINILNFTEKDLHIGDMVIILNEINPDGTKNPNEGILHRIIDIKKENEKTYYLTKGDNNEKEDTWFLFSDIHSKIIGVLY